jgi:hypothetical protein
MSMSLFMMARGASEAIMQKRDGPAMHTVYKIRDYSPRAPACLVYYSTRDNVSFDAHLFFFARHSGAG